jgi:hypothetical protein
VAVFLYFLFLIAFAAAVMGYQLWRFGELKGPLGRLINRRRKGGSKPPDSHAADARKGGAP